MSLHRTKVGFRSKKNLGGHNLVQGCIMLDDEFALVSREYVEPALISNYQHKTACKKPCPECPGNMSETSWTQRILSRCIPFSPLGCLFTLSNIWKQKNYQYSRNLLLSAEIDIALKKLAKDVWVFRSDKLNLSKTEIIKGPVFALLPKRIDTEKGKEGKRRWEGEKDTQITLGKKMGSGRRGEERHSRGI